MRARGKHGCTWLDAIDPRANLRDLVCAQRLAAHGHLRFFHADETMDKKTDLAIPGNEDRPREAAAHHSRFGIQTKLALPKLRAVANGARRFEDRQNVKGEVGALGRSRRRTATDRQSDNQ
jgi:hypothetical protein